jgi:L-ornithine Nalpha-acyltransferase
LLSRFVGDCVPTSALPELGNKAGFAKAYGVIVNVVTRARYRARLAKGPADLSRALSLRQRCFRAEGPGGDDRDAHDALCRHLLVESVATGDIAACCRVLILRNGREVPTSYSALHYDLAGFSAFTDPLMEIGRFCINPACRDPDILRVAWAALTRLVDRFGARMLFGCSSFAGASVSQHQAALAHLGANHRAPVQWAPGRKSGAILDLASLPINLTDPTAAVAALPPLLRSYLAMGGWVSDHAVIDRDLDTIHVFTGLDIAAIPPVRARALRALAAEIGLAGLSDD